MKDYIVFIPDNKIVESDLHVDGDVFVGLRAKVYGKIFASGDVTLYYESYAENVEAGGNVFVNPRAKAGIICSAGKVELSNSTEARKIAAVGEVRLIDFSDASEIESLKKVKLGNRVLSDKVTAPNVTIGKYCYVRAIISPTIKSEGTLRTV